MKKKYIFAILNKPKYYEDCDWLVYEAFRFDTPIQNHIENFMNKLFYTSSDYFLIDEIDLVLRKKYPHHLSYRHPQTKKQIDVNFNDVICKAKSNGGCSFVIDY
jgi:hypothetical protein